MKQIILLLALAWSCHATVLAQDYDTFIKKMKLLETKERAYMDTIFKIYKNDEVRNKPYMPKLEDVRARKLQFAREAINTNRNDPRFVDVLNFYVFNFLSIDELARELELFGPEARTDPFVDREGWGRALVPFGIFYRFLYGMFTHELIGHGIGEFSDEYVQYGKDDEVFPDGEMGKQFYLKHQKEKKLYQNVTFTTDPNDTEQFLNPAWAEMIRRGYRGVGTVEGAVYYGKGVWRATEHSVMVGNGLFENYNYFNPVQREILLRHIYELAGKGDEYSLDLFFEYDKRNEAYDRHPNETNRP